MVIHYWWQWLLIVVGQILLLAIVRDDAWHDGFADGWNLHLEIGKKIKTWESKN